MSATVAQSANPTCEAFYQAGNHYLQQGDRSRAIVAFRQAIAAQPDFLPALNNLGNILYEQEEFAECQQLFEAAVRKQPDFAHGYWKIGHCLKEQSRFTEAANAFATCVRYAPDWIDAVLYQAHALMCMGRLTEANELMQRIVAQHPDCARARKYWGMVLLTAGHMERGWMEYEYRHQCNQPPPPEYPQPIWQTPSPNDRGKTILLRCEQGLGDVLHFVRYAPLVQSLGMRVVLHCYPKLIRLLKTCPGIDEIVASDQPPPPFDYHVSLISLAKVFNTRLQSIPQSIPYVYAEPDRIEAWRRSLSNVTGFRIGIFWQGSKQYGFDRHRSFPLRYLEPVARVPGVRLISLQKFDGREQIQDVKDRFEVIELDDRFDRDPEGNIFLDSAAILQSLDLVIACDTAIAHLAGALGVPVWLALSFNSDWRWMRERDDSPWYPSFRLFRQTIPGQWSHVFETMHVSLAVRIIEQLL